MIIFAGILVYILSTLFRVLDNSAFVLISHRISVTPFYLSSKAIKAEMEHITDTTVLSKLRRNLIYKKLTIICIYVAIVMVIGGIVYEIYNPSLIKLFID